MLIVADRFKWTLDYIRTLRFFDYKAALEYATRR